MNADATTPRQAPGTSKPGCSAWRCVVEVAAAFGLPLPPLAAVAVAAVAGAFDLGGANLRLAPTSSASISATDRFAPSGVPAALAEPSGDHHPAALGQGVGQVSGLAAPGNGSG
jgi:hypothetical protein